MKEKTNVFAGKKINNYIEVAENSKTNPIRPNVSMQTLKQKKKINKQEVQQPIHRKKSKTKIIHDAVTPEKSKSKPIIEDEKSVNKRSSNKHHSKSY